MKRLPIYIIVCVALAVFLLSGYFLILYIFDGSTSVVLKSYEFTGDAEVVRRHLLEYRSGGEAMSRTINFLSWGTKNQEDFILISEGLPSERKDEYCELLGFMATDSGQDRAFEAAFEPYDSPCLRLIRSGIAKNRESQQRWQQRPITLPSP
ncbi:MAG: hypothetical protein KBD94_12630 [Pyrinomonadaceae bacterium]|nr:hypothetical protein [Pyrinomonadaceae bacterium]